MRFGRKAVNQARMEPGYSIKRELERIQVKSFEALYTQVPKFLCSQDAEEIKKGLSDGNEQIDKIWDIIEKAIIRSGESSLPNKSVKIPKKQLVPNRKKHRFKAYMSLGRLINEIRKAEHSMQSLLVGKWNQRLKIINRQAECNISMIELNSLQSWIKSAILWWKVIGNRISEESQKLKEKEIKNYIKKRSEMIIKEQRLMLASLLEKPFNKVRLDRVLVKEDLEYRLAVAPSKVLLDTKDHFKGQAVQRKMSKDRMYD